MVGRRFPVNDFMSWIRRILSFEFIYKPFLNEPGIQEMPTNCQTPGGSPHAEPYTIVVESIP